MSNVSTAVRLLGPRIPLMFKTAVLHALSLSETSDKWDVKTALIISTLRDILNSSTSTITQQQKLSWKDPGVKGRMWVSRGFMAKPAGDDVRQLVFSAIDSMKEGEETYALPELVDVSGEWTGYRSDASASSPELDISEAAKYEKLMAETTSPATILYFHGGAHYLMDPASHRGTVSLLCKLTGGRAFNTRNRLAPQNPFPAALVDALVVYLSLLYPPPGALHTAVEPKHIIFAGDSAGGNLSLALLQLLLQINRTSSTEQTILFHDHKVPLPLPIPAGVSSHSPWCDIHRTMPSLHTNAKFDYLPPPAESSPTDMATPNASALPKDAKHTGPKDPPACAAWPLPPPRADLYCEGSMLCHPLVAPLATPEQAWVGSCPIYFGMGEELLSDEGRVVARRIARATRDAAGADAQWGRMKFEAFEAMPHCFAMIFSEDPVGKRLFKGWTDWMNQVVQNGRDAKPDAAPTGGLWIQAKTLKEVPMTVDELCELTEDEVRQRMNNGREERIRAWQKSCEAIEANSKGHEAKL